LLRTIVHFYSYTCRIIQHKEKNRLVRTVVIAKRFDDKNSCIKSKEDNDNHNDKNDNVSRRLPISDVRRIGKVGYCAIGRSGRGHVPVVNGRVHGVRLSSRRAPSLRMVCFQPARRNSLLGLERVKRSQKHREGVCFILKLISECLLLSRNRATFGPVPLLLDDLWGQGQG
jgi:hypothetical protein